MLPDEKQRGRHTTRSSSRQPRLQPAPPPEQSQPFPRKSRSASRENQPPDTDRIRPKSFTPSQSRSLSRKSFRSHINDKITSNPPAKRAARNSTNHSTHVHHRGGGIPNVSFRRRRGRSETPKVGKDDDRGRSQSVYLSERGKSGVTTDNKYRSLSRHVPHHFSPRDEMGGHQQKSNQQSKLRSGVEYQFNRRRGKSIPSKFKVSLRPSLDPITKQTHAKNIFSTRSRSRQRSSHERPNQSKSRSNSRVKQEHVSSGRRQDRTNAQKKNNPHYKHSPAKDDDRPSYIHSKILPSRKSKNTFHHHNRRRSRSMPALGILRDDILHVNRDQSINYPISTIASVDSSWRYKQLKVLKRLKQKRYEHRSQGRRKLDENYVKFHEKERIRSVSCDPSMLRLALVPYRENHPSRNNGSYTKNYTYLNYGLDDIDDENCNILRRQLSHSSLDTSSLPWPSRSTKAFFKGRSVWSGVSTPTNSEQSSMRESKKYTTRKFGRYAVRGSAGDELRSVFSGEADTDTTDWGGHTRQAPVKSNYGSSYRSEKELYQYGHPTSHYDQHTEPSSPTTSSKNSSVLFANDDDGSFQSNQKAPNDDCELKENNNITTQQIEIVSTDAIVRSPSNEPRTTNEIENKDKLVSSESLVHETDSVLVKKEKMIHSKVLVPPSHASVRSRKPKTTHSIHHHLDTNSDTQYLVKELKPSNDVTVEGMTIPPKGSESNTDQMSELTIPEALYNGPLPPEFMRTEMLKVPSHDHSSESMSHLAKDHAQKEPSDNTLGTNGSKGANLSSKGTTAILYPPAPPPPPPPLLRRGVPNISPKNVHKQSLNKQPQYLHQQAQQRHHQVDIFSKYAQSEIYPLSDDLPQSISHLNPIQERLHHSDRALFLKDERHVEMTGGVQSGILHSSMKDVSRSTASNNWHLQQLLLMSTAELARLRGGISPVRTEDVEPPILSIDDKNGSRLRGKRVVNMPYTDENQDSGLYTGETNDRGQPHGKGLIKYDNGIFFEGVWINGVQDGIGASRERLMSGFTSWKGTSQSKKKSTNGKEFAHGMIWVDAKGRPGRYTGDLNMQSVPHGRGVMRYDFGLIAEGEWNNGRIIDDYIQGGPFAAGDLGIAPATAIFRPIP